MNNSDIEAADKKYGQNGWSDVEKLVLYRLDVCEATICKVQEDLAAYMISSQEARTDHYQSLKADIQDIKDTFANEALKRADSQKLKLEQATVRRVEQAKINSYLDSRLGRLEKILYGFLGAGGATVLGIIINHAL